jgi:hypothetical protein
MKKETLNNCIINALDIPSIKIIFTALLLFAAIFVSVYVLCSEIGVKTKLKSNEGTIFVQDTEVKKKENRSIIHLMASVQPNVRTGYASNGHPETSTEFIFDAADPLGVNLRRLVREGTVTTIIRDNVSYLAYQRTSYNSYVPALFAPLQGRTA